MRTMVIAEAAQGYEGKYEYCELYVKAAAKAGADAIKFQIVYADDAAEPGYPYYELYKRHEMDVSVWKKIKDLARESGIGLFADISGERAMAIAEAVELDAIKIHSSNFFNRSIMRRAFEIADRVFVSIGGIRIEEIEELIAEVEGWGGRDKLALLYGYQAVPTPVEKSNVQRIPLLKQRFPDIEIGYMDHAPGESDDQIHVSVMALAMGADWVEKHITLSRYLEVIDSVSALEPDEFSDYVATLRRLELAFGPEHLKLSEDEEIYRDRHVKKILTVRDLQIGHVITLSDLLFRRTPRVAEFEGFHDPRALIGKTLTKALAAEEPILKNCFSCES